MADDYLFEPIPIIYNGRDADHHELELRALGQSALGISRVLETTGQFLLKEQYVKNRSALEIRVLVAPPIQGSWGFIARLKEISQTELFKGFGKILVNMLNAVLAKQAGRKDADDRVMEAVKMVLEQRDQQSEKSHSALLESLRMSLDTIERIVRDLRPAAKQIVAPIGTTCSKLTIGRLDHNPLQLDAVDKEVIQQGPDITVTETEVHKLSISELDIVTGGCKVTIPGSAKARYPGSITDPVVYLPDNPYSNAMNSQRMIRVKAKLTLKEGEIHKIFISDLERS
jgi:hypothetical protein